MDMRLQSCLQRVIQEDELDGGRVEEDERLSCLQPYTQAIDMAQAYETQAEEIQESPSLTGNCQRSQGRAAILGVKLAHAQWVAICFLTGKETTKNVYQILVYSCILEVEAWYTRVRPWGAITGRILLRHCLFIAFRETPRGEAGGWRRSNVNAGSRQRPADCAVHMSSLTRPRTTVHALLLRTSEFTDGPETDHLESQRPFMRDARKLDIMTKEQIEQRLKELGEYEQHKGETEEAMRLHLQSIEGTRYLMYWEDGAALANRGYILYLVATMYDPAIHLTDEEYHQKFNLRISVQSKVEQPQIYLIARSSSSDVDQLLCGDQKRRPASQDGREFTDVLRIFKGDNPARDFDLGQQRGGYYPCLCSVDIRRVHSFWECCHTEKPAPSIQDRQEFILQGLAELNIQHLEAPASESIHDIYNHTKNILEELPAHVCREVAETIRTVKKAILGNKDTVRASDMRELLVILTKELEQQGKARTEVMQLLYSLVNIQKLCYAAADDRTTTTVYRLSNAVFKHHLMMKECFPGNPCNITNRRLWGQYIHSIRDHTPKSTCSPSLASLPVFFSKTRTQLPSGDMEQMSARRGVDLQETVKDEEVIRMDRLDPEPALEEFTDRSARDKPNPQKARLES
ncbi:hypothetical protein Bbelb_082570 [Branchiostoma belcheri]|nr:hypothetical protein Bbelb_082570 [Branchiostoma belcheri]